MSEQITMDGQYTYRNGEPARVLCVDRPGDIPVLSMSASGVVFCHDARGKKSPQFGYERGDYDLIKVEPFRRGEVVMVRHRDDHFWAVRVFKCVEGGKFRTFGTTSTSHAWHKCRRPEPGELEGKS